ncbi:hypothetical protein J5N97_013331 [Dioscorea zingiberensis]|uniref:Uncharacterized protein n=1 Tax=Dioscorea zingiberensis TaxID=325984 RepID=A0A9D5CRZ6_9LILI|nr:hypothetical protein J5N97_013331 [Dioscorea zingiberensis]
MEEVWVFTEEEMRRDMVGKRSSSFFSVPGLFVGYSTKGQSDCDSAKSPTSPLDYKLFSSLRRSSENRNIVFGSQMRINIPNPMKDSSALDDAPKSLPKGYGIPSLTEFKPVELGKICSCSLVREA